MQSNQVPANGGASASRVVHFAMILTTAITFAWQPSSALAAKPFFRGLGELSGVATQSSEAIGVSADGSVVVGVVNSARGQEAFRWTESGGMQGLGVLPGGDYSIGVKVSDNGTIVGYGSSPNSTQGFIWTSGGGMEGIGFVPGVGFNSYAFSISGDGSTVVGYASNQRFEDEAFRWTREEGIVLLGDLAGGEFSSGAVGVSQDGSTILGIGSTDAGTEMFLRTADGNLTPLGDLPPDDAYHSQPTDLSADASTAVGYGTTTGPFGPVVKAARWTAATGFEDLGHLPGSFENVAWAVSGDGSLIVGQERFPGIIHPQAIIWTESKGVQSLQDVLANRLGLGQSTAGWDLHTANDVSTDGKYIVGGGFNPEGRPEAWIARVPEPTSIGLAVVAMGVVIITSSRRPRSR